VAVAEIKEAIKVISETLEPNLFLYDKKALPIFYRQGFLVFQSNVLSIAARYCCTDFDL